MKKEDQSKEVLSEERLQQELKKASEEKYKKATEKVNAFIKELEKEGFTIDSKVTLTREGIIPELFVRRIR